MKAATEKRGHDWEKFIKFYSEQYTGRKTRLGVFERNNDVANDYWIESGLPLAGIDIDSRSEKVAIQIEFDSFTHEVNDAVSLAFHFTGSGEEDGLDITGSDGRTTILRFESVRR